MDATASPPALSKYSARTRRSCATPRCADRSASPSDAEWRLRADGTAVVEMARASGLALVQGQPDPIAASTFGTGELIRIAIEAGASRVGVGGSATVDGGVGAIEVLEGHLHGVDVVVACDVQTRFFDAPVSSAPRRAGPKTASSSSRRGCEGSRAGIARSTTSTSRGCRVAAPPEASREALPPSARHWSPASRSWQTWRGSPMRWRAPTRR